MRLTWWGARMALTCHDDGTVEEVLEAATSMALATRPRFFLILRRNSGSWVRVTLGLQTKIRVRL